MEVVTTQLKQVSRLPRKPERPYVSSLKSYTSHTTMDARRRPLRTYSKRTSSTETDEPPVKRRHVNDDSVPILQTPIVPTTSVEQVEALPVQPPTLTESLPPPATKGTIMAYFKKLVPESDSTAPSSELSSELEQPTTTPPSSPPIITSGKRRIRRLRTRIAKHHKYDDTIDHMDRDNGTDRERENEDVSPIGPETSSQPHSAALSTSSPNSLNIANIIPEATKRGKVMREKRRASVQTTLSLSLTDKGYAECKECDMLYNPLHESDAKHHARRHAALLKLKAKGGVRGGVVD
ncbi:hypothetical protein F5Y18DRAFT_406029 [Xylariaceae sp. FL1019]|nr:hypothetical protein F5Y18DRAFT_406029 [Xylariaceae sp. FL1019]